MRPKPTRLAMATVVLTSPMTTWWLVEDLSEAPYAQDRMFTTPEMTELQQRVVGIGATVALVAAFAGWAGRVMTAQVSGANIGGGLLLLAAPLVLLGAIT